MSKFPVTAAIRHLRKEKVPFSEFLYKYEARGGTAVSARELAVAEAQVVKTLVMEDETKKPLVVLMNGDCEVSLKNLARYLGVKTVKPCTPEVASKHTGYLVGGTSPFGMRKKLPVYMEKNIFEYPEVYINGGKRGFLVSLSPADVQRVLAAVIVEAGI